MTTCEIPKRPLAALPTGAAVPTGIAGAAEGELPAPPPPHPENSRTAVRQAANRGPIDDWNPGEGIDMSLPRSSKGSSAHAAAQAAFQSESGARPDGGRDSRSLTERRVAIAVKRRGGWVKSKQSSSGFARASASHSGARAKRTP